MALPFAFLPSGLHGKKSSRRDSGISDDDDVELTEAFEKGLREINENSETRNLKLEELRNLLKSRPDIRFRSDDAFLLRFLRNKKFDVERSFNKIVRYYEVRRDYTDIFGTFEPMQHKYVFDAEMEMVCPGRDKEGRRVVIARNSRWDPDRYEVADGFRGSLMMIEKLLEEEETQVNGMVFVADFEAFSMKHMTMVKPSMMKKMTDIYENALPLRIRAVHFVRQPALFQKLFNLVKGLLSSKLTSRLHFHGEEYGSLHQFIPSSMLPADLGGQLPEFSNKEWRDKLLASNEEFKENNKYGFPLKNETMLRHSGTNDNHVECLPSAGIAGTFKKIDD
ncbi:retinaldehyde-binding protein 1-like [Saccoglossus kowalevskii]|uniref:Alpha-tocopherol transfer protein-like n=1 Tax=Saccoglossus kowalevskii TaxID=10224 RepID=A0ABM0MP28_SACKO|nr:PREDICTED: alpha-tocopherol transfer protein-like [Saccoglossus kowalevskii]